MFLHAFRLRSINVCFNVQELKEEIARVLTTQNPQISSNIIEFSFKEGCFIPAPPTTQTVLLLDIEGTILHKDSDEAKFQLEGKLDGMCTKLNLTVHCNYL
jgi:dynein intermediate chain 1